MREVFYANAESCWWSIRMTPPKLFQRAIKKPGTKYGVAHLEGSGQEDNTPHSPFSSWQGVVEARQRGYPSCPR